MSLPILLLPLLLLLVLWSSRVGSTGQRPGESVLCRDTTRLPTKKTGEVQKCLVPLLTLALVDWNGKSLKLLKAFQLHCAFLSLLISAKYLSLVRRDPARYFHTHNPSSEQYVKLFIKRHITMPRRPRRGFPQFFSGPTRSTGTFSGTFERSLFYIKFQCITIHFHISKYNNKTLQYI